MKYLSKKIVCFSIVYAIPLCLGINSLLNSLDPLRINGG